MKMLFIFIDGFGLGEKDKDKNPIYAARTPNLDFIFNNYEVIPVDASLGVDGLPQSATGQTALFTGVNAPKVLGRHLSGQPTHTLKEIINKNNLFKELINRGFKVANSNVYRQEYLEKMMDPKDRKNKPSVTSVMSMSAGIRLKTTEDYKRGCGIYHDITGQILYESGYDVDVITPEEAARRIKELTMLNDFTLFEHFMTDIIGHSMDMDKAVQEVQLLDEFLGALIDTIDLKEDIIFITSDHGNIEDISVATHTFNKVPAIIIGNISGMPAARLESLVDITPFIIRMFETGAKKHDK
ncbi:MAG: peptidase [Acetivibrionales bacterium]|jgi:2,3-bisphosphoglycerate-independent phosphoglycerate mutase